MRYSRWITGPDELPGVNTVDDSRVNYGASHEDCDYCNYARHICGGCGEELNHDWTEQAQYGPERIHEGCCD